MSGSLTPRVDGLRLRPATRALAPAIARHADMAGEGLPLTVWTELAGPGGDPWAIGRMRAARDEGRFSWRNATLAELGGRMAGTVIHDPLDGAGAPGAGVPTRFVPLLEREALAAGTTYVNFLAVEPHLRGFGIGRALLGHVACAAPARGEVTLIALDANLGARRFHAAAGFAETARRPVAACGWRTRGTEGILLRAPVARLRGLALAPLPGLAPLAETA